MVDAARDEDDEDAVGARDCALDHLAVVGGTRNDGDSLLERVELRDALFAAYADDVVAAIE